MTIDRFEAVIFDMDGLLVDSERVWMICEQEVLRRRGKTWDFAIQHQFIGQRMNDFVRGMIAGYGLDDPPDAFTDEIVTRMCELIPEKVVPQPGAPELLDFLQARAVPCAIASSSPMSVIDRVVESQGWEAYFRARASGDDVPNGKPAPDVYLAAARLLDVVPARCLALEDSPNGARAAVAAGMTTFAVPDPAHTHAGQFDGITASVYDSLHDVLCVLKEGVLSAK